MSSIEQELKDCRAELQNLRPENERLRQALELFLVLATDAVCMRSVKWTTARDTARSALAERGSK